MYDISFDEQNRILILRQEGFWNVAMVRSYITEVTAETQRILREFGEFAILSDNAGYQVQSLEVMEAFAEFTEQALERNRGRPVAIIVSGALSRLQTQRIASGSNVKFFDDRSQAMAWLVASAGERIGR